VREAPAGRGRPLNLITPLECTRLVDTHRAGGQISGRRPGLTRNPEGHARSFIPGCCLASSLATPRYTSPQPESTLGDSDLVVSFTDRLPVPPPPPLRSDNRSLPSRLHTPLARALSIIPPGGWQVDVPIDTVYPHPAGMP